MTGRHVCEWGPWHPWSSTYRCIYPGCYKNMPSEEVAKRLNEYEALKAENAKVMSYSDELEKRIGEYIEVIDRLNKGNRELVTELETLKKATETLSVENKVLREHGQFFETDINGCKIICTICHAWMWDGDYDYDEPFPHKPKCAFAQQACADILEGK